MKKERNNKIILITLEALTLPTESPVNLVYHFHTFHNLIDLAVFAESCDFFCFSKVPNTRVITENIHFFLEDWINKKL